VSKFFIERPILANVTAIITILLGAVYTCPADGSGAYAQCDGGVCFRSTEEKMFPGFDKPVPKGQIICSCPITQATSSGANAQSYQILGPYPCDKSNRIPRIPHACRIVFTRERLEQTWPYALCCYRLPSPSAREPADYREGKNTP
jgi:hypothetical protein